MKFFRKLRDYFCYCGISKEEYKEVKKSAYISNFEVWRVLHFLMDAAFGTLFLISLFDEYMGMNEIIYGAGLLYSVVATVLFFVLKKDSIWAQLFIYLSISMLLLFSAFITAAKPELPAITFFAIYLIDIRYELTIEP